MSSVSGRKWVWWVVPLLIAIAVVITAVCLSGRDPTSPFLYDNF